MIPAAVVFEHAKATLVSQEVVVHPPRSHVHPKEDGDDDEDNTQRKHGHWVVHLEHQKGDNVANEW